MIRRHIFGFFVAAAVTMVGTTAAVSEELVVATDTSSVPFEFKQGDEFVGFDIDLWAAIAKDLGVSYKLQPMDFNGIIPALQTKQVDVAIANMTINDERKKAIDFSDGYYDSDFLYLVPQDSALTGGTDMDGKTIAVKTGTSGYEYAKSHLPNASLRLFPNLDSVYLEVISGRADAALHDAPNVLYFVKVNGQGKVKAVGNKMRAEQYGIAFPKGSDLREKVNASLAKLKADGTYTGIYKKWFGAEPKL